MARKRQQVDHLCPACSGPMVKPNVSVSRFVDGKFICSGCGRREAFDGFFWVSSPNAVPGNPEGFEPW